MTFLGETHYETRGLLVQVGIGIFEGRGLRIWLHRLNIYDCNGTMGSKAATLVLGL